MTLPPAANDLIDLFTSRRATVGVVGLGYVGLPLVRAMHDAGFRVVGFDIDHRKVELLREGRAYLKHLGEDLPRELAASGRFTPSSEPSSLSDADAIVLCVPTPLGAHREPDLSFVEKSTRMVAEVCASARAAGRQSARLISLESTTYPGTTRDLCLPLLLDVGLQLQRDFFLVFSPEREDPGRKGIETRDIPRLVGGVDAASGEVGRAFYAAAIDRVIAVESAEVAESAKLVENIYRAVNIALVNELKPVLTEMGIDIWQVIHAASTKPFGFQPFYPGPGWGGHCIPIDPFYLTWKAREIGLATRFIELAGEINHSMPAYVVGRTMQALNDVGKPMKGAKVLIVGVAYKPDIDDIRETPAAEIIEQLQSRGAVVSYHDPHIAEFPSMRRHDIKLSSVGLTEAALRQSDAVVVVTDHTDVDWTLIARVSSLIVDTRNAIAKLVDPGAVQARVVKA